MGVSRSASTVIAYAMKQYGWSLAEAHAFVKVRVYCMASCCAAVALLLCKRHVLSLYCRSVLPCRAAAAPSPLCSLS